MEQKCKPSDQFHAFRLMLKVKVKVKSLSRVQLFATPRTVAYQASPSMGFSRQEYWSGLPFPSPDLPDPGIEPRSPAMQADALPSKPPGNAQAIPKSGMTSFYWVPGSQFLGPRELRNCPLTLSFFSPGQALFSHQKEMDRCLLISLPHQSLSDSKDCSLDAGHSEGVRRGPPPPLMLWDRFFQSPPAFPNSESKFRSNCDWSPGASRPMGWRGRRRFFLR